MEHKPNIINEMMAKFTVKTLSLIKGEPNYKGINEMIQLLYTNVATLKTPQWGVNHGQIGSIMKPALYTTLTTMA